MTAASLACSGLRRVWLPRIGGAAIGGGLALLTLVAPLAAVGALALLGVVALVVTRRRTVPWLRGVAGGAVAVALKELRGRMRGRRAFTIVTLYLALLAGFAWAVIQIQKPSADAFGYYQGAYPGIGQIAQSAQIGQTLFAALLILLMLIIVVLTPAFTAGAVSEEREKQTFELLAATPLSGTAIVVGKLLSALVYLFLLILASIPLMSLVFTFGGVAVDDVVRAYLLLIATALGLGALGLFVSAVVGRTQVATILSYVAVLALTLASVFLFAFWAAMVNYQAGATPPTRDPIASLARRPPEALVWLNPGVAVADIVCGTGSGELGRYSCAFTTFLTNTPYFGQPVQTFSEPAFGGFADDGRQKREAVPAQQVNPFGVPRDLIWPKIALSEAVFALLLTIGSILLVSPTRAVTLPRLPRPSRPRLRRPRTPSEATP